MLLRVVLHIKLKNSKYKFEICSNKFQLPLRMRLVSKLHENTPAKWNIIHVQFGVDKKKWVFRN